MVRLLRYSLGVGVGGFALVLLFGWQWEQAGVLAVGLVAIGWLVWGFLALSDEWHRVAGFAFETTGSAVSTLFRWSVGEVETGDQDEWDEELEEPIEEHLGPADATRWVRVNDHRGHHYMPLDPPEETAYRRQMVAFLSLGARLNSFKFRDMEGRKICGSILINQALWTKFTDDLRNSGLFWKDKQKGTRPRVDVEHCFERVSAGVTLSYGPISGEVLAGTDLGLN